MYLLFLLEILVFHCESLHCPTCYDWRNTLSTEAEISYPRCTRENSNELLNKQEYMVIKCQPYQQAYCLFSRRYNTTSGVVDYRFACDYSSDVTPKHESSIDKIERKWYYGCFVPPCKYNGSMFPTLHYLPKTGVTLYDLRYPPTINLGAIGSGITASNIVYERINDKLQKNPQLDMTTFESAKVYRDYLRLARHKENLDVRGREMPVSLQRAHIFMVAINKKQEYYNYKIRKRAIIILQKKRNMTNKLEIKNSIKTITTPKVLHDDDEIEANKSFELLMEDIDRRIYSERYKLDQTPLHERPTDYVNILYAVVFVLAMFASTYIPYAVNRYRLMYKSHAKYSEFQIPSMREMKGAKNINNGFEYRSV